MMENAQNQHHKPLLRVQFPTCLKLSIETGLSNRNYHFGAPFKHGDPRIISVSRLNGEQW